MEKRLKNLLKFYSIAFTGLLLAGSFALFFIEGHFTLLYFTNYFLQSLSALSLTAFQSNLVEFHAGNAPVIWILMHCGALLYLYFSLQFANIIGQSNIFHNFKEGEETWLSAGIIFRKALVYLLILEAFSAIVIYVFGRIMILDQPSQFLWSLFHGTSVFTQSSIHWQNTFSTHQYYDLYILQLVMAGVLFIGRLGYPVFFDLSNLKRLRARMANPELNWTLQTRYSIYTSVFLLVAGSFVFWFGAQNWLGERKMVEKAIAIIFNISGWQSAGLFTLHPAFYNTFLQVFCGIFMMVGLAPGSFASLNYGIYANLFQRKSINRFKVSFAVILFCIISVVLGAVFFRISDIRQGNNLAVLESISVLTNIGLLFAYKAFFDPAIYVFLILAGRIGVPVVLVLAYIKFCKHEKPPEIMYI